MPSNLGTILELAARATINEQGELCLDGERVAELRNALGAVTDLAELKDIGRELLLFASFLADQKQATEEPKALYEVVAAVAPKLAAEQGRQGVEQTGARVDETGARFASFMGARASGEAQADESDQPKVKLKDLVKPKING